MALPKDSHYNLNEDECPICGALLKDCRTNGCLDDQPDTPKDYPSEEEDWRQYLNK